MANAVDYFDKCGVMHCVSSLPNYTYNVHDLKFIITALRPTSINSVLSFNTGTITEELIKLTGTKPCIVHKLNKSTNG